MAEAVVGSLVYQFKADIADLKNGFASMQTEVNKIKSGVSSVNDNFRKLGQEATKSVALNRNAMLGLSHEIRSVFEELSAGQSVFTVFVQQGMKIASTLGSSNGGATAALKQLSASILGLALSPRAALVAVTASLAAIGAAAYQSENSLEKLADTAKALGESSAGLKEFNRQLNILGVDPEKANEEMLALAQRIRAAQIAGGDLADKLAAVGININRFDLSKPNQFAQLFQQIADKVRNGSSELDRLNAIKFLGLSNEFLRLFDDGKSALDGLARSSEGMADETTKPIEEAWSRLRKYWSDTVKYIIDAAVSIADKVAVAVVEAIDRISGLIEYAKKKWAELKSALGMASPFPENYSGKTSSKAQELPPIDVAGGNVDLSGFSAAKAKSGSSKSARDQLADYIKNLHEANQLAKSEVDTFALGNAEKERSDALIKAENIAKQQGKTLTAEQRREIEQLAGSTQGYKDKVDQLKNTQNALNDAMKGFADFTVNALEGLITRSKKLSDVLRDVVKQLSSSALQGALTGQGAFGQMMGLSGQNGQGGGILGMLAKGATSLFSGFFADGGSIPSGKWGIAGEAGPELITGPANITPMANGGGAAKVTIHNYANAQVDARQMSDGQIIVTVQQMINAGLRRVPGIMADAQRRAL